MNHVTEAPLFSTSASDYYDYSELPRHVYLVLFRTGPLLLIQQDLGPT